MLIVKYSNKFKKDLETMKKRGVNIQDLKDVVKIIANQKTLPEKYKDHFLTGHYKRL